jgi:RND superfamily putative drug exporter
MLLVETDHDLRNSADMLVIDRIARASSTFPASAGCSPSAGGTPIEHVDPIPDQQMAPPSR